MGRVKRSSPPSRHVSPGPTCKDPKREVNQDVGPFNDHESLELQHCTGSRGYLPEWATRRVRYVYLTVKFELSPPSENMAEADHDCLYCSCRCTKPAMSAAPGQLVSPICTFSSCRHCLYYPESYPGRCIGKLRERSGSIAFMLRNRLENEMPITSTADEKALGILRRMPFGFELIEKVRRRYQIYPLGSEPHFDRSFFGQDFTTSVSLNGYDGYRSMLTNTSSMVKPMSRGEWDLWYHAQAAPPLDWARSKIRFPRRFCDSEARYLRYVVTETEPQTGSILYAQSPRIYVGNDDKYMRLELTSSPPRHSSGNRRSGVFRTFRKVTSEHEVTAPKYLEEDIAAGGYPNATLEYAPLKQFHPGQDRDLQCMLEHDGGIDVGETVRLTPDDKCLKIHLTSN